MPDDLSNHTQKLGELLVEAGLISSSQVKRALQEQQANPDLLLGEILALHGWIKRETVDFFAIDWRKLPNEGTKHKLGYYLRRAALLQEGDVKAILEEQKQTGVRFGTIAVFQGHLKLTTLDFFLMRLFPETAGVSPFINMHGSVKRFGTKPSSIEWYRQEE
ncbi:hypothetical protein [Myxosarcina sp. GI1]|uniref:hypothetical protein n=1 Tax=Myxosarcina sp. GI1 TaxID=1541065 RepID=UPI00068E2427|nr:hypothetical protein [Myxosarcina sp. GI1]